MYPIINNGGTTAESNICIKKMVYSDCAIWVFVATPHLVLKLFEPFWAHYNQHDQDMLKMPTAMYTGIL
jgi:hypothetical protein